MNHDQHQPARATATAPGQDQGFSRGDRVRPFPYWIIAFDGTLLRKRRCERELSQERLSHRSGISLRTIQRVEKLTAADCHVGTLQRLAAALSQDPGALISELTASREDQAHATGPELSAPVPPPGRWWQQARPFPTHRTGRRRYTAATARELLTKTGEFPKTKGGMLILLTEYRQALYDMATESAGGTEPATT